MDTRKLNGNALFAGIILSRIKMNKDLPMPTCKFCKETAEDCECSHGKDRLLSEQEIELVHKQITNQEFVLYKTDKMIAKAQLAKADKEWVEWLLENLFRETDYGLEWQTTPRVALKRLAERKLEIGL